ncbi:MAG: hypothetical protein IKX83_02590 [Clostridia bacterium]|nr:hypothetical protein [Clostridia bacterium]
MSNKAKIITGLIYALAVALLIAVVYSNLHPAEEKPASKPSVTRSTQAPISFDTTSGDLPYNPVASDKYANVEPVYKIEEVSLDKDGNNVWSAFVDGKKATDYIGVARGEYGWFFVRDGEVDFHYNGIAGNERGNWYIKDGKVDFSFTGTYNLNGTKYKVVEGQVIE